MPVRRKTSPKRVKRKTSPRRVKRKTSPRRKTSPKRVKRKTSPKRKRRTSPRRIRRRTTRKRLNPGGYQSFKEWWNGQTGYQVGLTEEEKGRIESEVMEEEEYRKEKRKEKRKEAKRNSIQRQEDWANERVERKLAVLERVNKNSKRKK